MSTRREVILSWLCEKRQTWRLCYLLGEAGSGKTWLAQQLQKDKHRRVITLSLVVSWQGKAAWIVTDDNAAEQGCRDSAWTPDEMAGQLLHALHRTDSRCPLIIIENAHLNHRRILDDLQRAISLIPDGQFLLIGRPDRKVERDFKKQGIELVSIGRLTEHELKASILEGQNIDQPDLLLTARVLKRIALLCRGDRRKLALAGETIRLLQQAEQTSVFTAKQWRMIYCCGLREPCSEERIACGIRPRMLFCSSRSKPFITDNTVTSAITPRVMPMVESQETKRDRKSVV